MNEEKHIQIIVAGMAGVGKSTIADIIHEALRDAGFANITITSDDVVAMSPARRQICVASLIESGNTINIQERKILSPVPDVRAIPKPE